MRKLNRRGSAAPTQPAPAAVVAPVAATPAPVAPTPIQPEVLPPAPVATDAALVQALAANNVLTAVGSFERPEALIAQGVSLPYLGFYHEKGGDAADVIKALGPVTVGTPYLKVQGNVYPAQGCAFLTLAEFPYWVTTNASNNYKPDNAWVTPRAFGSTHNGQKVSEQVETITLILPGAHPLHADLQPLIPTLTNWRGPRCKAVKQHVDAVESTVPGTPGYNEDRVRSLGPIAGFQPRFRFASGLRVITKPSKNGPYAEAQADVKPLSIAQMAALNEWANDADMQEEFKEVQEGYERRVSEIRALAEETAKK